MAVPTLLVAQTRTRDDWSAIKSSGFAVPAGEVLRSLHAALAMDQSPAPQGESVRRATRAALARMR